MKEWRAHFLCLYFLTDKNKRSNSCRILRIRDNYVSVPKYLPWVKSIALSPITVNKDLLKILQQRQGEFSMHLFFSFILSNFLQNCFQWHLNFIFDLCFRHWQIVNSNMHHCNSFFQYSYTINYNLIALVSRIMILNL